MGSITRITCTVFYSLLYVNSRQGFNGLKYVYSVISVIVDSLPGNTKNRESTRSWTARVRLFHPWAGLKRKSLRRTEMRDKTLRVGGQKCVKRLCVWEGRERTVKIWARVDLDLITRMKGVVFVCHRTSIARCDGCNRCHRFHRYHQTRKDL